MPINFEKQKYIFLNGTKYLIDDISNFKILRNELTIHLNLRYENNIVVIKYFNNKNFNNDYTKLSEIFSFRKNKSLQDRIARYTSKDFKTISDKVYNQKRLAEMESIIGDMFLIPTHWITDKNLSPLEFRVLCLIHLMQGFRMNDYIAEKLGCSIRQLIDVVDKLVEIDYLEWSD